MYAINIHLDIALSFFASSFVLSLLFLEIAKKTKEYILLSSQIIDTKNKKEYLKIIYLHGAIENYSILLLQYWKNQ